MDHIIALDGQYVDLNNPDHMGRAIRFVNRRMLARNIRTAPDTELSIAEPLVPIIAHWATGHTTEGDRRRVTEWLVEYGQS